MSRKIKILIISGLFLVLGVGVAILIWIITYTSIDQPNDAQQDALEILSITPPENPEAQEGYSGVERVRIVFNKNVSPEDIQVEISPSLEIEKEIGSAQNVLVIYPSPPLFWVPETVYTITILEGSRANDGGLLNNSVQHRIKSTIPIGGV